MAEKNDGSVKKKNGTILLIVILFIVIAALIAAVIYLAGKNKSAEKVSDDIPFSNIDNSEKRNVVVNQDNVEELIEQLSEDERVEAGNYEVVMNTTWNFKDGSSASENAYVENAVSNTNDVYFDVLLADTEENIFASPVLPIGSHIQDITLDKKLEAGTYDCVIVYNLIDKDQNVLSDVRVALVINVES